MSSAPLEVVEVIGRFVAASNATFLGRAAGGALVVYKPIAGERPLWDFEPATLALREVLTFEVARALGLDLVPATRLGSGPVGEGAIQVYVEPDPEFDPMGLIEVGSPSLWPMALLDVLCNNADRKAGHIFRGATDGCVYGIDHGLTFHADDKLRTVLWAFGGRRFPAELEARLPTLAEQLEGSLGTRVADLLSVAERDALRRRVAAAIERPVHPLPPIDRPPVPWPPI